MEGPLGQLSQSESIKPPVPAKAAKAAPRTAIASGERAKGRAAAAGRKSSEAVSSSPTSRIAKTTAAAVTTARSASRRRAGTPLRAGDVARQAQAQERAPEQGEGGEQDPGRNEEAAALGARDGEEIAEEIFVQGAAPAGAAAKTMMTAAASEPWAAAASKASRGRVAPAFGGTRRQSCKDRRRHRWPGGGNLECEGQGHAEEGGVAQGVAEEGGAPPDDEAAQGPGEEGEGEGEPERAQSEGRDEKGEELRPAHAALSSLLGASALSSPLSSPLSLPASVPAAPGSSPGPWRCGHGRSAAPSRASSPKRAR